MILNSALIYCHILTLDKEDTTVNYRDIFINNGPYIKILDSYRHAW
jgi:hypothetical protein